MYILHHTRKLNSIILVVFWGSIISNGLLFQTGVSQINVVDTRDWIRPTNQDAIDTPSDSRSVGMSESFVAVESDASSLMYNPAALNHTSEISTIYSIREYGYDRYTNGWKYTMIGASFSTPAFSAGLLYNRFNKGEYEITSGLKPDSAIAHINNYNYLIVLGASYRIIDAFTIGLSIKMFSTVQDVREGDFVMHEETLPDSQRIRVFVQDVYAQSYYMDIGATYLFNGPFTQEMFVDKLMIGASLQNFGTPHRFKSKYSEYVDKFPRYIRLGFSYRMIFKNSEKPWLQFLVTTQYSNLLNAGAAQNRHSWGYGLEATLYEFISMRISGLNSGRSSHLYTPYTSDGYTPGVRYGLGVDIPVPFLIAGNQMRFQLDYARIPVFVLNEIYNGLIGLDIYEQVRSINNSFSVALNYSIN